jgi:hypothetical protein
MATVIDHLDERLIAWIEAQHVFFVATAPSGDGGHVNVSPKGHDTFRVLDERTVAYLDLTGSGVETIAHLQENGRITFMFCSFDGPPRIVRLYGTGEVLRPGDAGFDELALRFPTLPGTRAIIRARLDRLSSSCGYSIPFMEYTGEREKLIEWADRKQPSGIAEYWVEKNATSIDGLPALEG